MSLDEVQKIPPGLLFIYPDFVLGNEAVNKIDKNLLSWNLHSSEKMLI